MTDAFDEVAHLAPAAIADILSQMGAETVVEFPDLLTHGPVATDPKRHRKVRLKYWRSLFESALGDGAKARVGEAMERFEQGYVSTEQLGSAAAAGADGGRIVIWTTPTLEDRLFLWFAFHALLEEGVDARQVSTAEPRVELPPRGDAPSRYASLRDVESLDLHAGYEELFYPELVYIEAGANLWETFSSSSPRQVALSIPHTTKFFPEFEVFAEDYGRLFPVARGEGATRLALSELDDDLLSRLDVDRARSAEELFDRELVDRYAFLDELVLLVRLRAWAETASGEEAYVEWECDTAAESIFERHCFRLCERGRSLLEEGFAPGTRLPLFQVGDSRLYAGKKPWVRRLAGDHWWFERFEPED